MSDSDSDPLSAVSDYDSDPPSAVSSSGEEEEDDYIDKDDSGREEDGPPDFASDDEDDDDDDDEDDDEDDGPPDLASDDSEQGSSSDEIPAMVSDDEDDDSDSSSSSSEPEKASKNNKDGSDSEGLPFLESDEDDDGSSDDNTATARERERAKEQRRREIDEIDERLIAEADRTRRERAAQRREAKLKKLQPSDVKRAEVTAVRYTPIGQDPEEDSDDESEDEYKIDKMDYVCAACYKPAMHYEKLVHLKCNNAEPCDLHYHKICWNDMKVANLSGVKCYNTACTGVVIKMRIILNGRILNIEDIAAAQEEEAQKEDKLREKEQAKAAYLARMEKAQAEASNSTPAPVVADQQARRTAVTTEARPIVVEIDMMKEYPVNPKPHYSRKKEPKKPAPRRKKAPEPAPKPGPAPPIEQVPEGGVWSGKAGLILDERNASEEHIDKVAKKAEEKRKKREDRALLKKKKQAEKLEAKTVQFSDSEDD